ncbi:basic leucine zipper 61-like [Tripterygium wilfordii]|uniref:Basic leucine zipper 61-like n=1 Tax=Tripterygium wilfordii TaxID=458696 RepID=A0A7J7DDF4_TRIWF|nr:basic leucine zipper 61-like [Tripterygium wilfordii]KAF5744106.1 basic leucine zipper 61-like [Tripterygium wilfordii]
MAQLPPKIPNWPDFSHQRIPSMGALPPPNNATTTTKTAAQNPSWVDEFLDFSSVRRGTHRRSASDSIAFLESPMLDECRRNGTPYHPPAGNSNQNNHHEFDKFDDDQFMSMFNDDLSSAVAPTMSSSNPSSPSDRDSINDEKETTPSDRKHQIRHESDEVQSQEESETLGFANNSTPGPGATPTSSNDRIFDPKRVKRILANRQSAQRSRVRKLQYISELERSVTSLQAEVSVLSPRVAFLDHQRLLLNVDNGALKQRMAALAQDKIFKDAHQEALKREIERLRQVYHQQNLKKIENGAPSTESNPHNTNQKDQQLLQV